MGTFADLERLRTPTRSTIRVQLNGDQLAAENDLRRRIAAARQAAIATPISEELLGYSLADPNPATANEAVKKLEAELDARRAGAYATEAEFTFQAVPYAELEALRMAHPPTAEQLAQDMRWNPDTFSPALCAASCVEVVLPGEDPRQLTDDEWVQLWAAWEQGLVNALYRAAWDVCNATPVIRPLSNSSSVPTPASVPN